MTTPQRAVFLSYAAEDAQTALRIVSSLRAAGIQVWFDQDELRGGDAWDQKIRSQIRDCSLFMPLISDATQARLEGYFRREWKLAVARTHDMADRLPFLVPVVVGTVAERDAEVPDAFRSVQWMRLRGDAIADSFAERIAALLKQDPACNETRPDPQRASAPPGFAPRRKLARNLPWLLVGAVLVVSLALWIFKLETSPTPAARPATTRAAGGAPESARPADDKSIAVLPFVDMSEARDKEYFSDGLSEELIDHLAHSPDLRIIARTSSFQFKGKNDDVRLIGQQLGVTNLLEGSVRAAGQTVRITVQLVRTSDGAHLWSQTYDRQIADLFAVQDEIATAVVHALRATLAGSETDSAENARNPRAHDLLL